MAFTQKGSVLIENRLAQIAVRHSSYENQILINKKSPQTNLRAFF